MPSQQDTRMGQDVERSCPAMNDGCSSLLGEGNASTSTQLHWSATAGQLFPGDGARPCWQRRTRAQASRERAKARAFWRGVRCAAGPPGLARDDHQPRAEHRIPTPGTRDMTPTEFLQVAAEIKLRRPHLRSEWSVAFVRQCRPAAQPVQRMKAIEDAGTGADTEANVAKEIMQYLWKGARTVEQLLINVLEAKTVQHFRSEADVERLCEKVEQVLQRLMGGGVIRVEPPGAALDEKAKIAVEDWCYELADVDAVAYNRMLESCVESD